MVVAAPASGNTLVPTTVYLYSKRVRKIIHVDCDCFYASVEMRDDPRLADRPLGIGGAADRRGVLCTANYLAREYGVRSAMPTATALRKCPDLIVMPTDMEKYRRVAKQVREIFARYTSLIEPLSLDEAYLDVTDCDRLQGSATLIARDISAAVQAELGITVSAGVAPNKFLAKVASDWQKPAGITVVTPDEVDAFSAALPVSKIPGVGPVTAQRMAAAGLHTCADLRGVDLAELVQRFGKFGDKLHEFAHGRDERPVCASYDRKSLSVERTFSVDMADRERCLQQLKHLNQRLVERLDNLPRGARIAGQLLKLKSRDFRLTTVDRQISGEPDNSLFEEMLDEAWQRLGQPVRLLGVGYRFLSRQSSGRQLSLL